MARPLHDTIAARDAREDLSVVLRLPSVRRWGLLVGAVAAATVAAGVGAVVLRASGVAFRGAGSLIVLFHLDSESNVPTMVSVLGLAAGGVLLLLVGACLAARNDRDATRWRLLGVALLYVAVDEGASIHERFNVLTDALGLSLPALRFGWVLLGGLAVVALAVVYLPTIARLTPRIRNLALASGALYVGGALGLELLGASLFDRGPDDPLYLTAMVLEESLEIAGIALFLVTLWAWWSQVAPRTALAHPQPAAS